MNEVLDAIIFYDELTSEQRAAVREAIHANPDLTRLFGKWRAIQHEVRASLTTQVPDRNLLVLYAIAQRKPDLLSSNERDVLEQADEKLQTAMHRHPALVDVINDIHSAQDDFMSVWQDFVESSASEVGELSATVSDRPPAAPMRRLAGIYRIAASFLLFALVLSAGYLIWRQQTLEIIKTSPGEFRVVELVDGSTVRLYGKSKISYTKEDESFAQNRAIALKGQAFFDIAPSERPFTVETATAFTRATGTKFSIEADRSLTEVILTAGQIAVTSKQRKGEDVLLAPGQMSQVYRRKQPSPPTSIGNLTGALSWTGLLVFHDTPLQEVADYLSSYYGASISIAPELLDEQFVATYDPDTSSVDEILDQLASTLGAAVQSTSENSYLLTY